MVEKKSIPCTFLFSGYRLVNIQGGIFVWKKRSILSELAKLLKISVTDDYKGMGFQQITQ